MIKNWFETFICPVRFTVHGLETGMEYVFRAKSVSQAGNSIYSDESEPILVKAAIRECACPPCFAAEIAAAQHDSTEW